jgi:hypothetical protein
MNTLQNTTEEVVDPALMAKALQKKARQLVVLAKQQANGENKAKAKAAAHLGGSDDTPGHKVGAKRRGCLRDVLIAAATQPKSGGGQNTDP